MSDIINILMSNGRRPSHTEVAPVPVAPVPVPVAPVPVPVAPVSVPVTSAPVAPGQVPVAPFPVPVTPVRASPILSQSTPKPNPLKISQSRPMVYLKPTSSHLNVPNIKGNKSVDFSLFCLMKP